MSDHAVRRLVRALFTAPFTVHETYIMDANNEMAASQRTSGSVLVARSWGRIQYMRDGAALMDAWEAVFAEVVGETVDAVGACARLNDAWAQP